MGSRCMLRMAQRRQEEQSVGSEGAQRAEAHPASRRPRETISFAVSFIMSSSISVRKAFQL
jgi:hypothetical protein